MFNFGSHGFMRGFFRGLALPIRGIRYTPNHDHIELLKILTAEEAMRADWARVGESIQAAIDQYRALNEQEKSALANSANKYNKQSASKS